MVCFQMRFNWLESCPELWDKVWCKWGDDDYQISNSSLKLVAQRNMLWGYFLEQIGPIKMNKINVLKLTSENAFSRIILSLFMKGSCQYLVLIFVIKYTCMQQKFW